MTAAPLISIRDVTIRFPGVVALNEVSLDVVSGELHAIVGENGAGKSTLMKLLAGVHELQEGEVMLRGKSVRFRSTRDAEGAGVSIIHQELNLVEQLPVRANLFLGRELKTRWGFLDEFHMDQAAGELLDQLECQVDPAQSVSELRVGDQQLVEIAKALSRKSDVLIMDEPTSALTETETERLIRVIGRLKSQGVTILYISHKMEEVFRLADRITVLRDGVRVATVPTSESSPRAIAHLMVGRDIELGSNATPRTPGDVILDVRKLSLPWPGHAQEYRLRDVSFKLHRGEVLGIAGLMGAGRTELLECLFGANDVSHQGEIRIDDQIARFQHPADALAAGVALVTEDRKRLGLFDQLDVEQNITMCSLRMAARRGIVDSHNERQMATSIVERLRVKTASLTTPITSLSGGNQQKCIIGRGLLTNPAILLLDDPTRGVDIGAKSELYRLIDELCRSGLAVIVTSSELPELLTLSDRILVLCEGELTGEFARHEATEQKIMEAATNRRNRQRVLASSAPSESS